MASAVPTLPVVDVTDLCCPTLAEAPLSERDAAEMARLLKALADPARLRLLSLLLAAPDGEACTCELTAPLHLSQPTVSHHLKRLAEAGLVSGERRGVWTWYRVNRAALAGVARVVSQPGDASRGPAA